MTKFDIITKQLRKEVIDMHTNSGTSHIASSLSCIDIIIVLYNKIMKIDSTKPNAPDRDRFILSKGHSAPALYAVLSQKGFFDKNLLLDYGKDGTILFEHPEINSVSGIEASTGSLGHGLPIGLGIAYASKLSRVNYNVFVLMSDGECQEGSVWEAAMLAPQLGLNNLICIVDYNDLQGYGRTSDIQSDIKIVGRFVSSGWNLIEVDGHDHYSLEKCFREAIELENKPTLILARTTKGKGVSQIENKLEWHYKSPTKDQAEEFKNEVDRN